MGKNKYPDLIKRGNSWHIDKRFNGKRICQSFGECNEREAINSYLYILEQHQQINILGARPEYLFKDAAIKYTEENANKSSIEDDKSHLKKLFPFIGMLDHQQIHDETLKPFIDYRLK